MRRRACALALCLGAAFTLITSTAGADFGFAPGADGFEVTATNEGGVPDTLSGSHPYALTTNLAFKLAPESPTQPGGPFTEGDVKDLQIELPAGLIENPAAVTQCTAAQFHSARSSPFEASLSGESCPAESQIGTVTMRTSFAAARTRTFGVFNLAPPPGAPSEIGFSPYGTPITLTPHVRQGGGEYGLTLDSKSLSQHLDLYAMQLSIWGVPWNPGHNAQRGNCLNAAEPSFGWAKCRIGAERQIQAYLTLPTSCEGPLSFRATADSWQDPGAYLPDGEPDLSDPAWKAAGSASAESLSGCPGLSFNPEASAITTTDRTTSPSGLHFHLEANEQGLVDPQGRAQSAIKKATVALPEGITVNPSVGAGLGYCTPAQYAAETVSSPPGAGCPNGAKIGDFSLETPLLQGSVQGSIFLAQPFNNPFGALLSLYLVTKSSERGIIVKVAGKVEIDQSSGQLTASFDDLPQLPYAHLNIDFREGQRAPLVTPSACATYSSQIELEPWLDPESALHETSSFALGKGIGGAGCPGGAAPPFTPGAQAGTPNSNAGSYTPFYLHLTRGDAEQEITTYSAKLAPGLLGKIAGIPYCPDAAIAAAKQRSGTAELEHPDCPAGSEIGHTVSGYGVGVSLTYAPGRLYLAGPYHGSPLSIVAVDSALVGPFDLGVVIVRSAIRIDPRSAQVAVDSAGSDPIPHIIDGIPIHLRDIRVYISRPNFTLNPTSCEPFSVASTLTGSSAPFTNPIDITATATVPFQVSNCSALKFAPKLSLSLRGGTRRGRYPQLRAVVTPHPGDANIAKAAVTLPPSLFLAQNHIATICTRPQLEAEACPAGARYGHATAITPLLGVPLSGPVYLRSSANPLPDLVAVLHGQGIRILIEGKIDSSHGGIRGTFNVLPDAPVSKFTMVIDGGKKGVLVNAANLCASPQLAGARFVGQDNQVQLTHPKLGVSCKSARKGHHHGRRR